MATTQTSATRSTVVGVFADRTQAQQCVNDLRKAGFREDQIGVAARDMDSATSRGSEEKGSYVGTGAATGAATGAGAGALWALGIAAGVLPAIGPAVAGGLLASILASAAGAAAVGGFVGALVGLGIPEEEARYYEGEFKAGRTIVTVRADNRYDEAQTILRRYGAYDIHNRGTATTASHATATSTSSRTAMPAGQETAATAAHGAKVQLHEERLHASTQPVKTGEVNVRKEVHTEHQQINVPVEREEVVIERRPVGERATGAEMRPEEIRIPVKEEKVNVTKEAVVKEEVHVGKRKVHDTQAVEGTVRKEELKVEETGDVNVHGDVKDANRPRK